MPRRCPREPERRRAPRSSSTSSSKTSLRRSGGGVLVPSNVTLAELHGVLNELMGWTNSHLHQFLHGDRAFGDVRDAEELELEDERKVRLAALVGARQGLVYEYDFGDSWRHVVTVEKELPLDARIAYPLCIGGARACPPEDCGGTSGYDDLLRALADEEAPDHDQMLTWVGGYFDPEGFDVNRTNQALRRR